VSNSNVRFPDSTPILYFAGITRAVEYGFIAAGLTVAAVAALQAMVIVADWIAAL
jgi:hypothetical protein